MKNVKKLKNALSILLVGLTLLCLFVFNNVFVYINAVAIALLIFAISRNNKVKYHNVANFLCISWLLILVCFALGLKFIRDINVFESLNLDYIFYIIYIGLIALCLVLQFALNKYDKKKSKLI